MKIRFFLQSKRFAILDFGFWIDLSAELELFPAELILQRKHIK